MQIHKYPSVAQLNDALAQWICDHIADTLKSRNRYTIALSGGSTPKALYELLASNYQTLINWQKVHVFFGDERYVPADDEHNNARMAHTSLLSKVGIPATQVHAMQTNISPKDSAIAYEQLLHTYFDEEPNTFDLVLLGMGTDGHTLSLFPGKPVVHENKKWVSEVLLNDAGDYRITLTAPVVNRAVQVAFLVAGKDKADTLSKVLQPGVNEPSYPAQRIQPASGNLHWFIDEDAGMRCEV